jgi:hypothetical protein
VPGLGTASDSHYQWLPSVFKVNPQYSSVSVELYINNLHPETCKSLYQPIADIFAASIPEIEACLTQCLSDPFVRITIFDDLYTKEFRAQAAALFQKAC